MEQENLNEINEEVVNPVLEEVSKSNNVLIKIVAGLVVVGAAVGGVILFKRRKNKKSIKLEKPIAIDENTEVSEEVTINEETVEE